MDVWEVPYSSCPGLDKGFLMDGGPERAGEFGVGAQVDQTEARDAEEQKTRNRSLAIGPLIVYPDGGRVTARKERPRVPRRCACSLRARQGAAALVADGTGEPPQGRSGT